MHEPMTPERLAEIRDLPYHAETHLLEHARTDLLAEVDRLNKVVAFLGAQLQGGAEAYKRHLQSLEDARQAATPSAPDGA